MRKRLVAVIVVALALLGSGGLGHRVLAEDQVDLQLVLAADISRSLDSTKFKLQREGYASALTNPKVIAAINSVPTGRIAICFVEWSGANAQAVVVDWMSVGSAHEAEALAQRILAAPRLFMERTAIGSAIEYSMTQFARSPFQAERRVIDVSGDGTSNAGVEVTVARDKAVSEGVTINGLAILSEFPLASNPTHTHPPGGLLKYYEDNVIGGQGAFALSAESFEAFGRSILNKLIKEIALAPYTAGSLIGLP
ncbi:MAG: DUF1194 domain-containing protein [Rhodospirillales bacterium]|nr:DUF1194 domain-containing protein [Rhodospirillales bacterium]